MCVHFFSVFGCYCCCCCRLAVIRTLSRFWSNFFYSIFDLRVFFRFWLFFFCIFFNKNNFYVCTHIRNQWINETFSAFFLNNFISLVNWFEVCKNETRVNTFLSFFNLYIIYLFFGSNRKKEITITYSFMNRIRFFFSLSDLYYK